jgi:hypothetical protein
MLRFSGCALVVLYALTVSASAEKISFRPSGGFETTVNWSDPSVQQAVIAAAPTDWHDTPGADVWWVTLEGQRFQVQVFPTLERPGAGEPNCCLHFAVDDTEFWLRIKPASSQQLPGQVVPEHSASQSSGQSGHAPIAVLETLMPITPWLPGGAPGDALFVDEAVVLSPTLLEHLLPSSGSGSTGESKDERVESEGASIESEFVVAQVPEPALLVLMGLGAAAALRRGRTRGRMVR